MRYMTFPGPRLMTDSWRHSSLTFCFRLSHMRLDINNIPNIGPWDVDPNVSSYLKCLGQCPLWRHINILMASSVPSDYVMTSPGHEQRFWAHVTSLSPFDDVIVAWQSVFGYDVSTWIIFQILGHVTHIFCVYINLSRHYPLWRHLRPLMVSYVIYVYVVTSPGHG